jgi:hypothetical protein
VLDFGTELEAELEVVVAAKTCCNVCVGFGESALEVEGLGLSPNVPGVPAWVEHRHIASAGRQRLSFEARGFRFVRIAFPEAGSMLRLVSVIAHAFFACRDRLGDLRCSDARFQRVWQASLYTARLCTRPDAYWDGIKRDRVGWYGDARITQMSMDTAFDDPTPAETMLLQLPVNAWANAIPIYSFDAIAMFRQMLLRYGVRPASREIYERVRRMLAWTATTHTNADGLFVRNPDTTYFFGIGFLDWSPMPLGGRFEELAWMQLRYVEALRLAAEVAGWLGRPGDASGYQARASQLSRLCMRRFHRSGTGFVHTLNRTVRQWEKLGPDNHYRTTYVERKRQGASGPSRHSCSLAVWAGLCGSPQLRAEVLAVLDDVRVAPVITPYFAYYEQCARAECGDAAGALVRMRDYVGEQLEQSDGATVWESYEPDVEDFRRWGLGSWPKSLCHGWSSGLVPMTTRYLLGVQPLSPGFGAVSLRPLARASWAYQADIPTPRGPIRVLCDKARAPVWYQVPRAIKIAAPVPAGVSVDRC